jgi:hypothetical protein
MIGPFTPSPEGIILRVVLDPNNEQVLYAIGEQIVYKSINGGGSWSVVFVIPNSQGQDPYGGSGGYALRCMDLEIHPTNSQIVYISTSDEVASVTQGTNNGSLFYRSIDGGLNWQGINMTTNQSGGFPELFTIGTGASRIALGVSLAEPSSIWAMLDMPSANSTRNRTLYKSSDEGLTWTMVSTTGTISASSTTYKAKDLLISPSDTEIIYLIPGGFQYGHKSTNGGLTFSALTNPGHVDVRDIALISSSPGGTVDQLLICHDGGVSIANDGGTVSSAVRQITGTGMVNAEVPGIGASNFGIVPMGSHDNGQFVYEQDHWTKAPGGGDGGDAVMDLFRSDKYYGQTWCCSEFSQRIYEMTNTSNGWTSSGNVKPLGNIAAHWIRPMSQSSDGVLSVGYNDLYQQQTPGLSSSGWSRMSDFASHMPGLSSDSKMRDFAISKSNPDVIYALFSNKCFGCSNHPGGYLVKTTTGGGIGASDWIDITANLPSTIWRWFTARKIVVNPNDENELWVAVADFDSDSSPPPYNGKLRVVHSEDGGASWQDFSAGLTEFPVSDLVYQEGADVLYAATDAGVFYVDLLDPSPAWNCFMNNAPVAYFLDLEIDYCSQELIVGTYGRGVWKSKLIPAESAVISQSETWSSDVYLYSDLVIANGATLTIEGRVLVPEGATITVEQGCDLVVDGGEVTSLCGGLWSGIYVAGDPNGQGIGSVHGQVSLMNGAIVSNAESALNNSTLDGTGSIDPSTSGGVLFASDAQFINNKRDVLMIDYLNENSQGDPIRDESFFRNCDFETNDEYVGSVLGNSCFLFDVEGVRFSACDFEDARTSLEPWQRRSGIIINSASATIDEYCSLGTYPPPVSCAGGLPSTFINMKNGISLLGAGHPLFNTSIRNSAFEGCWRGVYSNGSIDSEIWRNKFSVTPHLNPPLPDESPVGVYVDEGTENFDVQENEFYPFEGATERPAGRSAGLLTRTYHGLPEVVYNNEFSYLWIGEGAIEVNRDGNGQGVLFKCNTHTRNRYDILVHPGIPAVPGAGVRADQGIVSPNPLDWANNQFLLPPSGSQKYIVNYAQQFKYRYEDQALLEDPTGDTNIPNDLEPQNIGGDPHSFEEKCPALIQDEQIGLGMMMVSSGSDGIESSESVLETLVDDGNTEMQKSEVQSVQSSNAWEVYLSLLSESGLLSEVVLKEIASKEVGFSLAMLRDILKENPLSAKDDSIDEILDNRMNQLPEYMRVQIKSSKYQISEIEALRSELNQYRASQYKGLDIVIRETKADSLSVITLDSLVSSLELMKDWRSWIRGVEILDKVAVGELNDGKLNVMLSKLEQESVENEEIQMYLNLRDQLIDWRNQQVNVLALEDIHINTLLHYIEKPGRASSQAKAILSLNNAWTYYSPVFDPELEARRLGVEQELIEPSKGTLDVFPNPAKDYVTVSYQVYEDSELSIRLVDELGRVMFGPMRLSSKEDMVVVPLNVNTGVYLLELCAADEALLVEKVIKE